MYKLNKVNIMTSFITIIILTIFTLLFTIIISPLTSLITKDILLLVGLLTATFGLSSLMGESTSSKIINPFVKLNPFVSNSTIPLTQDDLNDIKNPKYLHLAVHHLNRSTLELTLSGVLIIFFTIL
ncbi:MAG: hypothetical protein ACRC7N_19570 [Clostridium sp.]